jgi:membrane peptidoglycan carboxypeptidase
VKTGTQQGFTKDKQGRDTTLYNWQVGYTPDLVVGVWIGNQDNEPVNNIGFETASIANIIWRRVMRLGLSGMVARQFEQPAGLERARAIAGRPGAFSCDAQIDEWWARGDAKPVQEQCRLITVSRPPDALLPPSPTPKPSVTPTATPTTSPTPTPTQAPGSPTPTPVAATATATPIPPATQPQAPAPATATPPPQPVVVQPTPIPTIAQPPRQPQPTLPAQLPGATSNLAPAGGAGVTPNQPSAPR